MQAQSSQRYEEQWRAMQPQHSRVAPILLKSGVQIAEKPFLLGGGSGKMGRTVMASMPKVAKVVFILA